MKTNPDPPQRLTRLFRPSPETAVECEIEHHIQERAERLVDEGWDPDAARTEAERRFGNVEAYRNETSAVARDVRMRRWTMQRMGDVLRDLRWTLRGARKNPGFAGTLVLTLALGIGGLTAIFAVLDAVILRPLPYDDPEELVSVGLRLGPDQSVPFLPMAQTDAWRGAMDDVLLTAGSETISSVRTDGVPELLGALAVTHDLDDLLGVQAWLGRTFVEDDARAGAERVVVLTYPYWRRVGGDEEIVGKTIRLEDEPWTVVGVLPRDFKFPVAGSSQIWIPLWNDRTASGRPVDRLDVIGRLREGVTLEQAQERADAMAASLAEAEPTRLGWQTRLTTVGSWRGNAELKRSLWMLSAAGGLMLLIALVNGVNLMLLRAQARARDFAVRRAIGASTRHVLQAVLTESVVLSLVAAGAAAGIAAMALAGIQRILPGEFAFSSVYPFLVEGRTVAFAFVLALTGGLAGGLGPALWTARRGLHAPGPATQEAGRGRRSRRVRDALVVSEVGLSVTLLVGASLFIRSFGVLLATDPGFEAESLAFLHLGLSERVYTDGAERRQFAERLVERLSSIPGADGAMAAQGLPPEGGGLRFSDEFQAEGREPVEGFQFLPYAVVPPDYLDLLGTPLLAGRAPRTGDREEGNVVIDMDFARALFGGEPAVGKRFRLDEEGDWRTVVGVVEELKLGGVDDQLGEWALIEAENPETIGRYMGVAVRSRDPAALLPEIEAAVAEIDPQQPIRELFTAEQALGESMARPRFLLVLMSVLAGLALVLAAIGTYGVMSYSVRRRQRETGIRIALGAGTKQIRDKVLGSGLALAAVGVATGLGLASMLTRYAEGLLFGIEPLDPTAFAMAAATMVLSAAVACWLPARRATRVDPVEVLNVE